MPPEDILALETSLLKLALNVYPGATSYVDTVLEDTNIIFSDANR